MKRIKLYNVSNQNFFNSDHCFIINSITAQYLFTRQSDLLWNLWSLQSHEYFLRFRFEESQVLAAKIRMNKSPLTMSIATNTDKTIKRTIKESKKSLEEKNPSKNLEPQKMSTTDDTKSFEENIDSSKSLLDVKEPTQQSTESTVSNTPIEQLESYSETLWRFMVTVIFMLAWLKNAYTSKEYKNKIVKIYRRFSSIFHNPKLQSFIKSAVGIFTNKILKLETDVRSIRGTTKLSLHVLPALRRF